jgi:tetraacyldisaccharide 4'-kinase
LYAAGLAIKQARYASGIMRPETLTAPVISVGNLSVGGGGKTPLVIRLAELLAARGFAVDVLSRGYGRQSPGVERVALDEKGEQGGRPAAERYGDEPLLIALATGVPVYVGADRHAAGLVAEQEPATGVRVHLLDDGFQHRQLDRKVDIVVLHRSDFSESLLPAGRLREPMRALKRASVLVMRVEDAGCEPVLRRRGIDLPIWWMTREIVPPVGVALQPAVAFCGIAHASEFFGSLSRAVIPVVATHAFADHHLYTDADVDGLVNSLRQHGSSALLTTEKDLIRLSSEQLAKLRGAARLEGVPLQARLLVEDQAMARLLEMAGLQQVPGSAAHGRRWGD